MRLNLLKCLGLINSKQSDPIYYLKFNILLMGKFKSKSIISYLLISVFSIYLFELLAGLWLEHKNIPYETKNRYIKLRERSPNRKATYNVPKKVLSESVGLIDQDLTFEIDNKGFAVNNVVPDNLQKIVFMGSSETESLYLPDSLRFTFLVEKKLQNKKPFKVLNAARADSHIYHSINTLLNKVLEENPKYCILMQNINDVCLLMADSSYHNRKSSKGLM